MAQRREDYTFGRRTFVKAAAGALAASPLLPASVTRAAGNAPKRLILFYSPDGLGSASSWMESGNVNNGYSPKGFLSPLENRASDITVVGGVAMAHERNVGEGHAYGMAALWTGARTNPGQLFDGGNEHMTGWGNGVSVDERVANRIGGDSQYKTVPFAVQPGNAHIYSRMTYSAPDTPVTPHDNPYTFFDSIFSQIGLTPAQVANLRSRRQSVLDVLNGELSAVRNRVDAADRDKIDAHTEGLRALEKRLSGDTACTDRFDLVTKMGDGSNRININARENFQAVGRMEQELLVHSLACGLTNVGSIQYSRSISPARYNYWLPGVTEHHHYYSHNGGVGPNEEINRWYAQEFANLIDLLKSTPDSDGKTLFDNTLVVWGREMGIMSGHGMDPVPFVLSGRCGGELQLGRYVHAPNAKHPRLLTSICKMMGLDDVNKYGELDDGSGGLPGL